MQRLLVLTAVFILFAGSAFSQEEGKNLAKELANPIATMITVPIQVNYDKKIGSDGNGSAVQTNIQPLLPFSLNDDWHLISRSIIPIIHQNDIPTEGMEDTGLGDILQSFFFSPEKSTENGWIWGAGPAMLLPTASDDSLGTEKFAVGPTAVALKQEGPWTVGALTNHLWSVAGDDDRSDVNATYLEPWVSYVTSTDTTISFSAETTYDWEAEEWSVPLNFIVDQLFQIGNQYVSIGGTVKYWAQSPNGGPEDIGFRLQMTLLFPK